MINLCNSIKPQFLPLKHQLLNLSSLPHHLTLPFTPKLLPTLKISHHKWRVKANSNDCEIDMVKTRDGIYTAKPKKVVVLWDLDNKPPRGPPYQAALALKQLAQKFGEVVDISAYANRHAFIHLPNWVVDERRERRQIDVLERKGVTTPSEPYICSVCGRKCKTNMDLKKHFRQLHERERQKKLNRLKSLKGKKRKNFKERFIDGNEKYNEAARSLITPKVGYGLAAELRRAGVFVKTVADKPQAADWALKRQMQHSMSRGIDWMFLVSDDSDFLEMLRRAGEANLGTVVVGDVDRALGRQADLWVPWIKVENGEILESDLKLRKEFQEGKFSVSEFDGSLSGEVNWEDSLDEFNGVRVSSFSEGEEEEESDDEDDWLRISVDQRSLVVEDEDEDGIYIDRDEDEMYL